MMVQVANTVPFLTPEDLKVAVINISQRKRDNKNGINLRWSGDANQLHSRSESPTTYFGNALGPRR
jgi:hypothetical protein